MLHKGDNGFHFLTPLGGSHGLIKGEGDVGTAGNLLVAHTAGKASLYAQCKSVGCLGVEEVRLLGGDPLQIVFTNGTQIPAQTQNLRHGVLALLGTTSAKGQEETSDELREHQCKTQRELSNAQTENQPKSA